MGCVVSYRVLEQFSWGRAVRERLVTRIIGGCGAFLIYEPTTKSLGLLIPGLTQLANANREQHRGGVRGRRGRHLWVFLFSCIACTTCFEIPNAASRQLVVM